MTGTDVRERLARSCHAGGPVSDLFASKLRGPLIRPGTVRRSSLIERLTGPYPIVSVVAPAGYGKTTLLSQWAERSGQGFAWVSVDEADNDPRVLLTYVAEALDAVESAGERVFGALASPRSSVPGSVVPRLGSAFSSMASPVVLVLDDVHVLHNSECRFALSVLADHVPGGSRLVLAGRAKPPLRIARLRAEGKILEIGLRDLSLTCEEASSLLRNAGVALGEDEVAELHRRTEGWPAGLYLAALCLREGGSLASAAASFGGDDRLVSEYLERSNLLLVPLDRRGEWYRYHHLFRDMLRAELHCLEPGLIPVLRRRAAGWCLRNDLPEAALEYSMAAGDVGTAACLVQSLVLPAAALWQGVARVLSGDLDGGDASFEDVVAVANDVGAAETASDPLCQRSLLAMAGDQWSRAEILAEQARTALREARIEESYPAVALFLVLFATVVITGRPGIA